MLGIIILISCLVGKGRQIYLRVVYMYVCTGTRFSDGDGSSNEVQRTMLELINQLDGFDPRGNIKVLMATNRYNYAKDVVSPRVLR